MIEVNMPNQEAKKDAGKPEIDLVPMNIVEDIAWIRMYGNRKYPGNPNNWMQVDARRYHNALARHLIEYLKDPYGNDEESGLPHLWHIATNAAFLCNLEDDKMRPTNDIYPKAKTKVDTKKELKVEPEDDFVFIDFDPVIKEHKSNIDFDEDDREDNKNNWMEYDAWRPFESGLYEFNFTDRDKLSFEGYYVREYDYVLYKNGMKIHPKYWRNIK